MTNQTVEDDSYRLITRLIAERREQLAALRLAREALDTDALNDSVNKLQTDAYDAVCAAIEQADGNT